MAQQKSTQFTAVSSQLSQLVKSLSSYVSSLTKSKGVVTPVATPVKSGGSKSTGVDVAKAISSGGLSVATKPKATVYSSSTPNTPGGPAFSLKTNAVPLTRVSSATETSTPAYISGGFTYDANGKKVGGYTSPTVALASAAKNIAGTFGGGNKNLAGVGALDFSGQDKTLNDPATLLHNQIVANNNQQKAAAEQAIADQAVTTGSGGSSATNSPATSQPAPTVVDPNAPIKPADQPVSNAATRFYAASPQQVSQVSGLTNGLNAKLTDIMNDPWTTAGIKQEKRSYTFDKFASDTAKLFPNVDSLLRGYETNPDLKQSLDGFIQAGGNLNQIAAKIPDYSNIKTGGNQSTADYLSSLNQAGTSTGVNKNIPGSLVPEAQIVQEQISRDYGILDDQKKLYFGSNEDGGVLDTKIQEAKSQIDLIDQKLKDDKQEVRDKYKLQIDKANQAADLADAEIEQNRLTAKTYITELLAKMGALTTTGAAGVALTNLEEKYQAQKQKSRSSYNLQVQGYQLAMNTDLSNLETSYADKEDKVRNDLTKDENDIQKELLKLRQDAEKNKLSSLLTFAKDLRAAQDRYTAKAKAEADKNTVEQFKLTSQEQGKLSAWGLSNAPVLQQQQALYGTSPSGNNGREI